MINKKYSATFGIYDNKVILVDIGLIIGFLCWFLIIQLNTSIYGSMIMSTSTINLAHTKSELLSLKSSISQQNIGTIKSFNNLNFRGTGRLSQTIEN